MFIPFHIHGVHQEYSLAAKLEFRWDGQEDKSQSPGDGRNRLCDKISLLLVVGDYQPESPIDGFVGGLRDHSNDDDRKPAARQRPKSARLCRFEFRESGKRDVTRTSPRKFSTLDKATRRRRRRFRRGEGETTTTTAKTRVSKMRVDGRKTPFPPSPPWQTTLTRRRGGGGCGCSNSVSGDCLRTELDG